MSNSTIVYIWLSYPVLSQWNSIPQNTWYEKQTYIARCQFPVVAIARRTLLVVGLDLVVVLFGQIVIDVTVTASVLSMK